ncbi:MAG: hypothetical protein HYZ15_14845 [Sphingobacteriales bacterium]|nr:hypothetical protein [Sphingobacteriales bacterium]
MQRKLLILAIILVLTAPVHGQFSKGDRMLGATVGTLVFNSGNADIAVISIGSNTSKVTSYGLTVNPSLGWFVSGNTVLGATLNLNPNGQKTTYEQSGSTYQRDKNNGFNIGFGGFARNYFSAGSSLLPFAQLALNGGLSSLKTEGYFYGGGGSGVYKISYTGSSSGGAFFNTALSGGFTKLLGENAGLDFFLGYNFSYNRNVFKKTTLRDDGNNGSVDTRSENETTTKFTNHGFTAGVGFQVFLRKRK